MLLCNLLAKTLGILIAGCVTCIIFITWELKYAKIPVFIPAHRRSNRTEVFGILAVSIAELVTSTNWLYLSTYFQVTRRISLEKATLLGRGYYVAHIALQFVVGCLMMKTKTWRPYLWIGIALMTLGVGLLISARFATSADALIVVSETIASFGAGMIYVPLTVAIQSAVPHEGSFIYFYSWAPRIC